MNVFKYIWLKVVGHFKGKTYTQVVYEKSSETLTEKLLEKYPPDLPPKEKDPARWKVNTEYSVPKVEEKPKRSYNRATKQQVARIKALVGRGKTAKQIAKDVVLPYDNVNYYVKKFGG